MTIGERRQRDVGAGDAEDHQRQQPFRAPDVAAREHRLREDHQDRAGERGGDEGCDQAVHHHADMRLIGRRKLLREPALQAHRGELRGELDDDHRISEPAQQFRSVEPPGDEQEGDPRREPQDEAEEIRPAALGERGDVMIRKGV